MLAFVPKKALKNKDNLEKIEKILDGISETDLCTPGDTTLEEALQKIRDMGEDEIVNLIHIG